MKNKTILITGGTSGIGYEIVKQLQQNNTLLVIGKDKEKLNNITKQFPEVLIYQADLSNLEDVAIVAEKIIGDFSTIDLLINNAAVQYTPSFLDKDFKYGSIEEEITINFTALCSLTYKLLPLLLRNSDGVILNVNSGLALAPKTSSAIYCATKGALNIFTQSLRHQLENTNTTVLQVFLELVDTNMTKGRGKNKISPQDAAERIIYGIENRILDHDIGKVKLLRFLLRLMPQIAQKIMKKY